MLREYNIENDPGLRTDEDFIFNIRSFAKAGTTVIVDEPLYEYTHRNNSLAHAFFKDNISQYIDNRIKRVHITQDAVKEESYAIREWSTIHIIMYLNELLGKVALFPKYYSDKRIKDTLRFIKKNSKGHPCVGLAFACAALLCKPPGYKQRCACTIRFTVWRTVIRDTSAEYCL